MKTYVLRGTRDVTDEPSPYSTFRAFFYHTYYKRHQPENYFH